MMQHIDEGTIHAWLDNAVDAVRAREIDAHVASCRQCAESVAEARGLIAGASRVLTALDDVPAGVTVRRAPVVKRQWRAAPWVTGIAAALVLAIGVTQWNRDESARKGKEAAGRETMAMTLDSIATTPASAPLPERGALAAERGGAEPAPVPSRRVASEATPRAAAQTTTDRRKEQRALPSSGDVSAEAMRVGTGAGAPAATARDAAAAPPPAETPALMQAPVVRGGVAGMRQTDTSRSRPGDGVAVSKSAAGDAVLHRSEVSRLTGCYRTNEVAERRVTESRDMSRLAARARAEPSAQAAPRADFAASAAPRVLRLDSTRTSLGYVVRSALSDSTIGWWRDAGGDSARVELHIAGVHTVSARDRVSCP